MKSFKLALVSGLLSSTRLISATLLCATLASTGAFAGSGTGNGGGALVCRDAQAHVVFAQMYEDWEYGDYKIHESNRLSAHKILERAYAQLQKVDPIFTIKIKREVERVEAAINEQMKQKQRHAVNVILDSRHVLLPPRCPGHADIKPQYEQVVNFEDENEIDDRDPATQACTRTEDGLVCVDQEIMSAFAQTSRAAILLHEAIYKIFRDAASDQDSSDARRLTSALVAGISDEALAQVYDQRRYLFERTENLTFKSLMLRAAFARYEYKQIPGTTEQEINEFLQKTLKEGNADFGEGLFTWQDLKPFVIESLRKTLYNLADEALDEGIYKQNGDISRFESLVKKWKLPVFAGETIDFFADVNKYAYSAAQKANGQFYYFTDDCIDSRSLDRLIDQACDKLLQTDRGRDSDICSNRAGLSGIENLSWLIANLPIPLAKISKCAPAPKTLPNSSHLSVSEVFPTAETELRIKKNRQLFRAAEKILDFKDHSKLRWAILSGDLWLAHELFKHPETLQLKECTEGGFSIENFLQGAPYEKRMREILTEDGCLHAAKP